MWRALAALLVALLPAFSTVLLIKVHLDAYMQYLVPHFWNDQTRLWQTALTMHEVGFEGGNYTLNEHTGRLGISHFDVKGPYYALVYGNLARVVSWEPYTPLYINMIL